MVKTKFLRIHERTLRALALGSGYEPRSITLDLELGLVASFNQHKTGRRIIVTQNGKRLTTIQIHPTVEEGEYYVDHLDNEGETLADMFALAFEKFSAYCVEAEEIATKKAIKRAEKKDQDHVEQPD